MQWQHTIGDKGERWIKFNAYYCSGDEIARLAVDSEYQGFYESIGFIRNIIQPIELEYDSPISMRLAIGTYLAKINMEIED